MNEIKTIHHRVFSKASGKSWHVASDKIFIVYMLYIMQKYKDHS